MPREEIPLPQEIQIRLRAFAGYKHMTVYQLAQSMGIGKNSLYRAAKDTGWFTPYTSRKLTEFFPELNMKWMRTGKGDMVLNMGEDEAVQVLRAQLEEKDKQIEALLQIVNRMMPEK